MKTFNPILKTLLLLALCLQTFTICAETIVIPPGFENKSTEISSDRPFFDRSQDGEILQMIINSNVFSQFKDEAILIKSISFRPRFGGILDIHTNVQVPSVEVRMGISSKITELLPDVYKNQNAQIETLVYSNKPTNLRVDIQQFVIPDFTMKINLDTPFLYAPSLGHFYINIFLMLGSKYQPVSSEAYQQFNGSFLTNYSYASLNGRNDSSLATMGACQLIKYEFDRVQLPKLSAVREPEGIRVSWVPGVGTLDLIESGDPEIHADWTKFILHLQPGQYPDGVLLPYDQNQGFFHLINIGSINQNRL